MLVAENTQISIVTNSQSCLQNQKGQSTFSFFNIINGKKVEDGKRLITKAVKLKHCPLNEWQSQISFWKSYISSISPLTPFWRKSEIEKHKRSTMLTSKRTEYNKQSVKWNIYVKSPIDPKVKLIIGDEFNIILI